MALEAIDAVPSACLFWGTFTAVSEEVDASIGRFLILAGLPEAEGEGDEARALFEVGPFDLLYFKASEDGVDALASGLFGVFSDEEGFLVVTELFELLPYTLCFFTATEEVEMELPTDETEAFDNR